MVRYCAGVLRALEVVGVSFLAWGPPGVFLGLFGACERVETRGRSGLLPSLRKGHDEAWSFVSALCGLHVQGHGIDWTAVFEGQDARRVLLPTYAFQRERYWLSPVVQGEGSASSSRSERPLWDAIESSNAEAVAALLEIPEEERSHVSSLLPRLAAWHNKVEAESTVESWRYAEKWRAYEAQAGSTSAIGARPVLR